MNRTENLDNIVILNNVRISYPALFVKRSSGAEFEPRYQATFLVDKKDQKSIEKIKNALKNLEKVHDIKILKNDDFTKFPSICIADGDNLLEDNRDYENYKGYYRINAKNVKKIKVISPKKVEYLCAEECPLLGGDYVNVKLQFWYLKEYRRVGACPLVVQYLREGKRFGKGAMSEEELLFGFKEEEEEEDLYNV